MNLYREESGNPTYNAQRNLHGRTHYVDGDTLRFHKSRILSARAICGGLLFAIIESVAVDCHNMRRGVRYVLFDVFGNVVGERASLDDCYNRREQAEKAMWAEVNKLDPAALTLAAIEMQRKAQARELDALAAKAREITADRQAA